MSFDFFCQTNFVTIISTSWDGMTNNLLQTTAQSDLFHIKTWRIEMEKIFFKGIFHSAKLVIKLTL